MDLINEFSVDLSEMASNLILMGVAFVLALPVALNRELESRSAGMRTFPLVAIASCALMLIGIRVLDTTGAEARVIQGIITGMGFIGGGAILKSDMRVRGLATAASLWATGAMGIAVAWQRFEIAVVISLLLFVALWTGTEAKRVVNGENGENGDKEANGE